MFLTDLLFPKICLECGREGKYICDDCLSKVPPAGWYGDTYAVFRYQGVVRKAIIALKYKFASQVAQELADTLTPRIKNLSIRSKEVVLIPIPLHRQRENWRGFNQAGLVGKKLAEKLGWEFDPDLLVKSKKTTPQVELRGNQRRENLHGVFAVNSNYSLISNGYSLIIFDDVSTTGSTINEAKKALLSAGAKKVWGLTIAR